MKVLLIMPPFQTNKRFYKKAKWHFPFSIWYIGTYLKGQGYDVTLFDGNLHEEGVFPNIYDTIGISCITAQVPMVRNLCKRLRINQKAKVVVGGVHPTLFPNQKPNYIDELHVGDYMPFNAIPPLNYSLLDKAMMAQKDKDWLGLVTSKGCPYECTFCVNSIIKQPYQAWSAERVVDEIKRGFSYGFKNIFFWDDNFFANRKRLVSFIHLVKQNKLHFEWFAFTRSNHLDSHLLAECYSIGLRRLGIGAESGSPRILKKLNKGITVLDTESSARMCNTAGIETNYSYMIGLPGERRYDILQTIEHLKRMGKIMDIPKIAGPLLYQPYPGSKLYQECLDAGWKQPESFEEWNDETSGVLSDVRQMPWVEHKDMVAVYHFYSLLIPFSYYKIVKLFLLYIRRTNRRWFWMPLLVPILLASLIGKVRHRLSWYRFPIETRIFKRWRGVLGV